MSKKVIILLVEGPTEEEFYKAVIKRAHDIMQSPFNCFIEYQDMRGIGNYKNDARRRFNKVKEKYSEKLKEKADFYVYLCIDLDVFTLSKKPPIDKQAVHKTLKESGAKKVKDIIAKNSIEDWFLADKDGVLNFLGLNHKTKIPNGSGQEVLKQLFKNANKVYVKGSHTKGFIRELDIGKIMSICCDSLNPLCKEIGLKCDSVCKKREN